MTEIHRAMKYLVEPIKVICHLILSLLQTPLRRNEVNIPSVEGCEIKSLERCLSHGQGKNVVPPPSKWICRDQRGNR